MFTKNYRSSRSIATQSGTLAWKTPWMEEPCRLQSMRLHRAGHNWATSLSLFTFMHWRRKWQPTPVFLPGESQGQGAWWAAVYGVTQSRTRLKRLSSSSRSIADKHLWLRFRQRFLSCNIKIMKEQNDKSNFIKIKTFCSLKELLRQSRQIKGKHLQSIILKKEFTSIILNTSQNTLEKTTAPHSSTLAWKIPWTEEPGRLQSKGSRRVRHDWATSLSLFTFIHWRRKWQPTPVFLPGES